MVDVNIPLSAIDRMTRQIYKSGKTDKMNTINHLELIKIYKILQIAIAECTCL